MSDIITTRNPLPKINENIPIFFREINFTKISWNWFHEKIRPITILYGWSVWYYNFSKLPSGNLSTRLVRTPTMNFVVTRVIVLDRNRKHSHIMQTKPSKRIFEANLKCYCYWCWKWKWWCTTTYSIFEIELN